MQAFDDRIESMQPIDDAVSADHSNVFGDARRRLRNKAPNPHARVAAICGSESSSEAFSDSSPARPHATLVYLSAIFFTTAVLTTIAMLFLDAGAAGMAIGWLWLPFVFLAASHGAVNVVNALVSAFVAPAPLARLKFRDGIPVSATTLVVVPALLSSHEGVDRLFETLQRHRSGNRDENISFALLTDFLDASTQAAFGDDALLEHACMRLRALNRADDVFFLLHRPRRLNVQDRTWMGHERKRGKLMDLAEYLVSGRAGAFMLIEGPVRRLASVKYVLTLDSDNELPEGAVCALAAIIAHPSNRATAAASAPPRRGYAILQPQPTFLSPTRGASRYERLACADPVRPGCVPDLYQDLFGEGIFQGKGILDVRAFHAMLHDAFPDNQILSHDVVEGCFARCGLASDVRVPERYPATYHQEMDRRHRWTRGDWQSLPWVLPRVRDRAGAVRRNPLSALSRWKLLDNVRRTVIDTAFVVSFLMAWFAAPSPFAGTVAVLALFFIPALLASTHLIVSAFAGRRHGNAHENLLALGRVWLRAAIQLAVLVHQALLALDAIGRALWRMWISGRQLLQWRPFDAGSAPALGLAGHFQRMGAAVGFAVLVLATIASVHRSALPSALTLLAMWCLAPALTCFLDRPRCADLTHSKNPPV